VEEIDVRPDEIKNVVRKEYAKFALAGSSCCPGAHSCCGSAPAADDMGRMVGYTEADLKNAPEGANLGLGCGNPVALASLQEGEISHTKGDRGMRKLGILSVALTMHHRKEAVE
jgi:hypothetical protein